MFSYLPGNEEECQNSLRIINRTKKAPVNGTKINKNYNVETIEEIDDAKMMKKWTKTTTMKIVSVLWSPRQTKRMNAKVSMNQMILKKAMMKRAVVAVNR